MSPPYVIRLASMFVFSMSQMAQWFIFWVSCLAFPEYCLLVYLSTVLRLSQLLNNSVGEACKRLTLQMGLNHSVVQSVIKSLALISNHQTFHAKQQLQIWEQLPTLLLYFCRKLGCVFFLVGSGWWSTLVLSLRDCLTQLKKKDQGLIFTIMISR